MVVVASLVLCVTSVLVLLGRAVLMDPIVDFVSYDDGLWIVNESMCLVLGRVATGKQKTGSRFIYSVAFG